MVIRSGVIPKSARLDPTASGTCRAISTFRSGRSGPVKLPCTRHLSSDSNLGRWYALLESSVGRECLVRLSHHTADGMQMLHRSSLGLELWSCWTTRGEERGSVRYDQYSTSRGRPQVVCAAVKNSNCRGNGFIERIYTTNIVARTMEKQC
jgi:hypothetical protein